MSHLSFQNCIVIAPGGCTLGDAAKIPTKGTNATASELETNPTAGDNDTNSESIELDESFENMIAKQIEAEEEKKTMAEVACPLGVYGNMPDPEDCASYYYCTGQFATKMYCSIGFEFDPELKVS